MVSIYVQLGDLSYTVKKKSAAEVRLTELKKQPIRVRDSAKNWT